MRKLYCLLLGIFMFAWHVTLAQTKEVAGKVTDSKDGAGLAGVTVSAKGFNNSTTTSSDGTFRLTVPSATTTLVFSYVGYGEIERAVSDLMNVNLDATERALTEVIVVGYGTKIKRDLTGNIARVKGEEVKDVPVPNFTQALQGRAAGVFVESQNGKVGEGIKVRIRGAGSISASNEPLYVVDGIPINTGVLSGNALADINFNDIESFDILKDASAAAIYGSRAANGVVLITTKRGKAGKSKVTVGLQYGSSKPTGYRGFLNADEYITFFTEAARNGAIYHFNREGNFFGYIDEQEAIDDWVGFVEGRFRRYDGHVDYTTGQTNTNWEKLAFQKANTLAADVTLSGGNEKTKFYISGGYNDQDGILVGNTFQRVSGRVNLDHEVSSKFKLGTNLSVSRTKGRRVQADNEFATPMQLVALSPITPLRDTAGNLYDRPTTTYYNGLVDFENGEHYSTTFRNLATIYGQFNFTNNFFFRSEYSLDLLTQNDDEFYGSRTLSGGATNGFGRSTWFRTTNQNTNNYFNYTNQFADRHDFDATLGMSLQKAKSDFSQLFGEDFPVDALRNLASAGKITGGSSTETNYSFLSYFARVNYKLNDRYLLSVSGRIDGSSRFGKNTRYGFFPAVSAGWIITEEDFLKDAGVLSFLKLRASFGYTGNAEIGNFPQLGLWGATKYNQASGLTPTQLANPDLKWEKSQQTDIGIDFGFFNNRLSGELDYYVRNTTGLLYNLPVPMTTGFTTIVANVGEMQNKGFEIVLNSTNVNSRDFRWTTSLNFSRNFNKITKLDGDTDTLPGNDGRYLNSLIVGQPIGVFYGPKYAGVDPTNGDGLFYLEDGKTTTNDYNSAGNFVVGNPNPEFFYGFSNTFSYKGIELNVLFQGVHGNQIINGAGGFMSANGDWLDNQTRDQLASWKSSGDVTMIPQARLNLSGSIPNAIGASSRYVEDGSYLRLKTISLGYNIPETLIRRFKLTTLRVYVLGQNLATWTNYSGWDPEVNTDYRAGNRNQGGDFYAAPQIKTITFGINIGL